VALHGAIVMTLQQEQEIERLMHTSSLGLEGDERPV
jgi:hypothetical protein